jgi:formate C-acetyltransferase
MRKDFIAAPKYGNNEDLPDSLVAEVYQFFADTCYSMDTAYGGKVTPNAISISAHQPGGQCTGATPDGRKSGDILADASLSPDHGKDTNGPLAVLNSAMKVNQDPYQGTLLNMKFHPSALKTDADLEKLGSMVKTYLTNGGKHIQFNVVDREEMLDAKVNPDEHPELVVRVAGYSAYFTRLSDAIQDEVIERTAQSL